MQHLFRLFAHWVSEKSGTSWAFAGATLFVVSWALAGSYFEYSQTWQLFINTGTTILTFLMVFIIQNTQNREARATQLKLDELIRASKPARDNLIDAEDLDDEELELLEEEYRAFRAKTIAAIKHKRERRSHA